MEAEQLKFLVRQKKVTVVPDLQSNCAKNIILSKIQAIRKEELVFSHSVTEINWETITYQGSCLLQNKLPLTSLPNWTAPRMDHSHHCLHESHPLTVQDPKILVIKKTSV